MSYSIAMSAKEFRKWQDDLALNNTQAAKLLGTSRNSVAKYRLTGASKKVLLACHFVVINKPKGK